MRRSALSKAWGILLLLPLGGVTQQTGLIREGDHFVREFTGSAPVARRLRINAHGPVKVEAGATNSVSYTVRVSVRARSEAEARDAMERYGVRVTPQGDW